MLDEAKLRIVLRQAFAKNMTQTRHTLLGNWKSLSSQKIIPSTNYEYVKIFCRNLYFFGSRMPWVLNKQTSRTGAFIFTHFFVTISQKLAENLTFVQVYLESSTISDDIRRSHSLSSTRHGKQKNQPGFSFDRGVINFCTWETGATKTQY